MFLSSKMSIAVIENSDCWLRIVLAIVQKAIEYQDWRLLYLKKKKTITQRLTIQNVYRYDREIDLQYWVTDRPGNKPV